MIKPWILEFLIEAAHANCVSLRTDYSGRGMFGRKCIGLTGTDSEVNAVISETLQMAVQDLFTDTVDLDGDDTTAAYNKNDDVQRAIATLIGGSARDSMGRDIIVYWPDVEWPEGMPVPPAFDDF